MKKSNYYFIILLLFVAGTILSPTKLSIRWTMKSLVMFAHADDDEEERDNEEDDERAPVSTSTSSSKPKTETVTTYVKLPDQIIKRLITNTIYDSDGDGVFDPDDPTPNLNDIFIVKDDNANGINDAYENEK